MCKKLIYLMFFVLVLGLVSSASAELVAHWKFDEGSGDTAFDSSDNNYHAILVNNPEWVPGKIGSFALNLDAGGYGGIQGLFYQGSGFPEVSVCAWIRTSSASGQFIASFDRNEYWRLAIGSTNAAVSAGQVGWHVQTDAGTLDYGSVRRVDDGQWHHVCGVYDNGLATIYIDGEPEPSQTQGTTWGSGNLRYGYIGKNSEATAENQAGPGGNPVDGDLDDLRIYHSALSEAEILAVMADSEGYPYALGPEPADGALHEDTWINLSWRPGDSAVSHDVYLGENFDDVDSGAEGTFIGNQAGTDFIIGFPGFPYPDGLVPGTTYYWRIDEVNEAEPNSPWKGSVWSFSIPPKTAYFPDPADGAESVDPNADLSWTPGFGAVLHHSYFGDNFDDVNNATGALPLGDATFDPGPMKLAETYYWRVDEFDAIATYKGDVWSFTTEGAVAALAPSNGAVDVKQTQILTWSPSVFAASHEVYFGSDKVAVKNADTSSPEYKGSRALGSESYDPGMLEWNGTYYWRIDEVNNTNPDSPWTGPLWSFTTANFLVVDDFEDYDVGNNEIWWVWVDGLGYASHPTLPLHPGNGTGSMVGDETTGSYMEETIVHRGNQSMPVFYDNSVLMYSEVEKTLTYPRDWTENGVSTLSIWFRGISDNAAETLYVALNGSAVVSHDNPEAAQTGRWTEWNIDLQAFTDQGVNLANVNTIALGLGNKKNPVAGGSGTMYFDDIRLYRPTP
jgi:hypothetical protein